MSEPAGRIVGQVSVVRACGCTQAIDRFDRDRFLDARLDKLRKTRCPACAAKYSEDQRQAAAAVPKRGEALGSLPTGTAVTLTRRADGTWAGTLTAEGTAVEAAGESPAGVTVALAQRWVMTTRPRPAGPPA